MKQVEFRIPTHWASRMVPRLLQSACTAEGLTMALKGTLAKYPGCIHWHFKKGKQRGTLEVTWWPPERRLWFKISAGRRGDWMGATLKALRRRLASL